MNTKKLILPILGATVLLSGFLLYCQVEERGVNSSSSSSVVKDTQEHDISNLDTLPVAITAKLSLSETSLESICCNADLLQLLISESNKFNSGHRVSQNGQYTSQILSWPQGQVEVAVTNLKNGTQDIFLLESLGFEGNENVIPLNTGGILHDHFIGEGVARIIKKVDGNVISTDLVNNTDELELAFNYYEESNSYYYATMQFSRDEAKQNSTIRKVSGGSVNWSIGIPGEIISSKIFHDELMPNHCVFATRNSDFSYFLYIISDENGKTLLRIPIGFTTNDNTSFKIVVANNQKFVGVFNAAGYALIDLERMEIYKTDKDTPLPKTTVCNSMSSTDSAIFISCYTRKKVPSPGGGIATIADQHYILKITNQDNYNLRAVKAQSLPILTKVNDTLVFASLDSSNSAIQLQKIK